MAQKLEFMMRVMSKPSQGMKRHTRR
jgi:hypothetical protein